MLHVCTPCGGSISRSYLSSVDVCFRCLFMASKNFCKTRYSLIADCVLEQNPRNLAFSVCRTTFPRFSNTSGRSATSMMDPSAARILDPLRRSSPLTKPPTAACTLRMIGCSLMIFCWNPMHFWYIFGYSCLHSWNPEKKSCWNIIKHAVAVEAVQPNC